MGDGFIFGEQAYKLRKKHMYQKDGLFEPELLHSSFDDACSERYDPGLDKEWYFSES